MGILYYELGDRRATPSTQGHFGAATAFAILSQPATPPRAAQPRDPARAFESLVAAHAVEGGGRPAAQRRGRARGSRAASRARASSCALPARSRRCAGESVGRDEERRALGAGASQAAAAGSLAHGVRDRRARRSARRRWSRSSAEGPARRAGHRLDRARALLEAHGRLPTRCSPACGSTRAPARRLGGQRARPRRFAPVCVPAGRALAAPDSTQEALVEQAKAASPSA